MVAERETRLAALIPIIFAAVPKRAPPEKLAKSWRVIISAARANISVRSKRRIRQHAKAVAKQFALHDDQRSRLLIRGRP